MDKLNEYIKYDIGEAEFHVRSTLILHIPDMKIMDDYDEKYYKEVDKYLHEHPWDGNLEGKQYDNLKGLVMALCEEYKRDMLPITDPLTSEQKEDLKKMKDDPEAYMATNFGL